MELITKFKNLAELTTYFPDDQSCRAYLEQMRWNGQPVCPHCAHDVAYKFAGGTYYKCKACRKKFTVTIGTIFEDSHIPLRKWFIAVYIFSSHKKGISSCQLAKDLGITQKSAWHMLHRIRHSFGITEPFEMSDTVEVDETYVGGKRKGKRGRGAAGKTAVIGLVERRGKVYAQPVSRIDADTLQTVVRNHVAKGARVVTDELPSYNGLARDYRHDTIRHGDGVYVRGDVYTNTIEGYWSLLKRGIIGIYHQVGTQHLHRYCSEFDFRYNSRKSGEVERFNDVLTQCDGRLMYKTLTGKEQ
jgi:transposase-like protein